MCLLLMGLPVVQAIEAQEYPEVEIKGRTKISSSITYQTLFKYYFKLSGMTVCLPYYYLVCHLVDSSWHRIGMMQASWQLDIHNGIPWGAGNSNYRGGGVP